MRYRHIQMGEKQHGTNWTIPHLELQYSINLINNNNNELASVASSVRRHVHTQVISGNVRLVCFRLPLTVTTRR